MSALKTLDSFRPDHALDLGEDVIIGSGAHRADHCRGTASLLPVQQLADNTGGADRLRAKIRGAGASAASRGITRRWVTGGSSKFLYNV
jgi:hypothetical protein